MSSTSFTFTTPLNSGVDAVLIVGQNGSVAGEFITYAFARTSGPANTPISISCVGAGSSSTPSGAADVQDAMTTTATAEATANFVNTPADLPSSLNTPEPPSELDVARARVDRARERIEDAQADFERTADASAESVRAFLVDMDGVSDQQAAEIATAIRADIETYVDRRLASDAESAEESSPSGASLRSAATLGGRIFGLTF